MGNAHTALSREGNRARRARRLPSAANSRPHQRLGSRRDGESRPWVGRPLVRKDRSLNSTTTRVTTCARRALTAVSASRTDPGLPPNILLPGADGERVMDSSPAETTESLFAVKVAIALSPHPRFLDRRCDRMVPASHYSAAQGSGAARNLRRRGHEPAGVAAPPR
jgi:hypothetical protein